MRMMMKGDLAFFYHSNCKVPGIAGIMEIVQEHTPDGKRSFLFIDFLDLLLYFNHSSAPLGAPSEGRGTGRSNDKTG